MSLKAELLAQLDRRESRLKELRAAVEGGESVPDATLNRVAADVDALKRELKAFGGGGDQWYAVGAEQRLVSKSGAEVTRAANASRDRAASGGYLDSAGEWAEVSEAASAVTRLDVAIEKLAAAASVTGKPVDWAEMNELKEQRTVWVTSRVGADQGHRALRRCSSKKRAAKTKKEWGVPSPGGGKAAARERGD